MLNRIIVIGRITADPELKYLNNGSAVSTFNVAVDRPFRNTSGEKETDFIPVVTYSKLAEVCANNLAKGRLVAVEGRLQVRSYAAKDGGTRWVSEIVADNVRFLDYRDDKSRETFGGVENDEEVPF